MVSGVNGVNGVNVNASRFQSAKQKRSNEIKGDFAGAAIGLAVPGYTLYDSLRKMTPEYAKDVANFFQKLMPEADTLENTKKVSAKILEETGLKAKGVKINFIDGSKESLDKLKQVISTEANQSTAFGKRLGSNYFETFKAGANAAFFPKANEIVVNSKNLYTTVYHEMGHAMNKNGNWLTKGLQKARAITPFGVSIFAPVFLAVGLFHKVDKNKPAEEKGKIEKTLDFVSDNAGKLTFASYLPLLAEEGLASIRGLKHAAKHLPTKTVQKLAMNYTTAWGTYAATAAIISGGIALGIKAANHIKEGKQAQQA